MNNSNVEGLSEEVVCRALTKHRGDLILASESIGKRPSQLVRYIKSVPSVEATYLAIEQVKASGEFNAKAQAAFEQEVRSRAVAYKLDGLEVIHEIAVTPHTSAAEGDVRLRAAIQLRGIADAAPAGTSDVLAELNSIYHQMAPRIKTMRIAAQIEFSEDPQPGG